MTNNVARETAQMVLTDMISEIDREIASELTFEQDLPTECYIGYLRERRAVLVYMLEVTK